MSQCPACKKTIVFGGKKAINGEACCSSACLKATNEFLVVTQNIPEPEIERIAEGIHKGECPCCHKRRNGTIDVHRHFRVFSIIVFTRWNDHYVLACRSCALKKQWESFMFSLLAGWWGLPYGLIVTPVQLCRNLKAMLFPPNPRKPSLALKNAVRKDIYYSLTGSSPDEE